MRLQKHQQNKTKADQIQKRARKKPLEILNGGWWRLDFTKTGTRGTSMVFSNMYLKIWSTNNQ